MACRILRNVVLGPQTPLETYIKCQWLVATAAILSYAPSTALVSLGSRLASTTTFSWAYYY